MALAVVKEELLRHLGNAAYRIVVVRQMCFEIGRESFGLSEEQRETIDEASRTRRGPYFARRALRLSPDD